MKKNNYFLKSFVPAAVITGLVALNHDCCGDKSNNAGTPISSPIEETSSSHIDTIIDGNYYDIDIDGNIINSPNAKQNIEVKIIHIYNGCNGENQYMPAPDASSSLKDSAKRALDPNKNIPSVEDIVKTITDTVYKTTPLENHKIIPPYSRNKTTADKSLVDCMRDQYKASQK